MISTALVVYFVVAMLVSFVCSLLEAVVLSTTASHVQLMVQENRPGGRTMAWLKERVDRPLIAILTLNTLANMSGSAAVGAEAARGAAAAGISDALPVAIAASALTACILVFSEIIPKTLGATYWRGLAPVAATVTRAIVWCLTPIVVALEFIPRFLADSAATTSVTREEVLVLTEMGRRTGTIPSREGEVIGNLLRLNLMRVRDVMTPRVDLLALQKDRTIGSIARDPESLRFSRIPIYGESSDQIVGIVLRYRVLEACLAGRDSEALETLKAPIHIVPESKSIASVLDEFIRRHEHLFLVVNEYGGTEGVISLEDVIETLLGVEIADEMDGIENLRRVALRRIAEDRQSRHRAMARVDAGDRAQPPGGGS